MSFLLRGLVVLLLPVLLASPGCGRRVDEAKLSEVLQQQKSSKSTAAAPGKTAEPKPSEEFAGLKSEPKKSQSSEAAKAEEATAEESKPKEPKDEPAGKERPLEQKLQIVRVVDPRLPDLNDEQWAAMQRTLETWALRSANRKLKIEVRKRFTVEEYFGRYEEALKVPREGGGFASLRFKPDGDDGRRAILEILKTTEPRQLRTFFPEAPAEVERAVQWVEYLARVLTQRFESFQKPYPPQPASIAPEHPEYGMPAFWRALAEAEKADLLVTNVLIAGPEQGMDLDRLRRGGLLVGIRSVGMKKNNLGGTLVVSYQPALCRAPFALEVADGRRPELAGTLVWCYLRCIWQGERGVFDPLNAALQWMELAGKE